MGKVVGVVAVVFMMGAGTVGLFGGMLGAYSETAALGLMGVGLVASSQVLSGRLGAAARASQASVV